MEIKDCPFCGKPFDPESHDTLYPSGIFWRRIVEDDIWYNAYFCFKDHNPETDHACWELNCPSHEGGCGAQMHADSKKEVIKKWNRRA